MVIFSKLDANCGFWQIPLADSSRLLTTFVTPFGRYCFNKLPFGICSALEHFQKRMSQILSGQAGALCHMDDVIIFGCDRAEHDSRLHQALQKIQEAGVTLNREKCVFHKNKLTFLGHIISKDGISPDPAKTSAIVNTGTPKSVSDLRMFLGMANQLGKFTPQLANMSQPLRELMSPKKAWQWGPTQEKAFLQIKKELTRPTVLATYNPRADTKISSDASAYGLGAVLFQSQPGGEWKPVSYASRSLSETEQRYAQIEKEVLAIVWACERFADYIIGKQVHIETDHKPLIPLLGKAQLSHLPPRLLRFRLRLTRFQYSISHVPGKLLYKADFLSRSPTEPATVAEEVSTEAFVQGIVSTLPADDNRLEQIKRTQHEDPVCSQVMQYVISGWPSSHQLQGPNVFHGLRTRGLQTTPITIHN